MSANQQAPPRCRMCALPAAWRHSGSGHAGWSMYCTSGACTNSTRICQKCDSSFIARQDGASSKYCKECERPSPRTRKQSYCCVKCGKESYLTRPSTPHWPYLCADCLEPFRAVLHLFNRHRAPLQAAIKFIEDPTCAICTKDLLVLKREGGTGKLKATLNIDHNHECCPGNRSCGKCIRGPLCSACNMAIGLLRDDPNIIYSALDYIQRPPWSNVILGSQETTPEEN